MNCPHVIRARERKETEAILSESDALDLKWNRTFNKHSLTRINIPLDLPTWQHSHEVKSMWRSDSTARVANTVEQWKGSWILLAVTVGYHKSKDTGNPEAAVHQLVKDLVQVKAFKYEAGTEPHLKFLKFPSNLLRNFEYCDLHTWMNELLMTWEPIYELNRV